MFTTIDGIVGKGVSLAEKINDPFVTWDDAKRVQHVGVVTTVKPLRLVQAMPGGAVEIELTAEYFTDAFVYVRPPYAMTQGLLVAIEARRYIGVPYSFLDYAAIAGRHVLALKSTDRTPFDRHVSSTKHMICSQLADQALSDAGFHVFDDGRIPQDVTPAALYRALLNMGSRIVTA